VTTAERLIQLKTARSADDENIGGTDEEIHLTPAISCGVAFRPEEAMPSISSTVLDWFEEIAAADVNGGRYANEQMQIPKEVLEESHQSNWADRNAGGWSSDDLSS